MTTMRYRGYALALSDAGWHAEGYRCVIGPYGSVDVLKAEIDRRANDLGYLSPEQLAELRIEAARRPPTMIAPVQLDSAYTASGHELDLWADACEQDVCRRPGEPDAAFRERVIAAMFPPPSGPTIAQLIESGHLTPVTIGHKSRVYPWAGVLLGLAAWIVLIAAVMAFKHWVFG